MKFMSDMHKVCECGHKKNRHWLTGNIKVEAVGCAVVDCKCPKFAEKPKSL